MLTNVFVISLEDAIERRKRLVDALRKNDIAHELCWAVDGRNGLPTDAEARVDRAQALHNMGRPMSDAEFGCALSHQDIYREIIKRGIDHAVILEDDAILTPGFVDLVRNFALEDYDLLLLDHWRAQVDRWRKRNVGGGATAYRALNAPLLTTGYVVSAAGARKMVDHGTPVTATADWPCDIAQMQTYAFHPPLIDHPDPDIAPSDIRTERAAHQALQSPPAKERKTIGSKLRRLLTRAYWHKIYRKRFGKWIS